MSYFYGIIAQLSTGERVSQSSLRRLLGEHFSCSPFEVQTQRRHARPSGDVDLVRLPRSARLPDPDRIARVSLTLVPSSFGASVREYLAFCCAASLRPLVTRIGDCDLSLLEVGRPPVLRATIGRGECRLAELPRYHSLQSGNGQSVFAWGQRWLATTCIDNGWHVYGESRSAPILQGAVIGQ